MNGIETRNARFGNAGIRPSIDAIQEFNIQRSATDDFSTLSSEFKKWDKGHSTLDVPHRLVASYIYELPFGRGKQLFNGAGKAADLLLGGTGPSRSQT